MAVKFSVRKIRPVVVAGAKPPDYPYIHPAEPEPDKSIALAGGDYERGRALFFGDKSKCSTCHRIRGEGKTIGPDLSNFAAKDAASVLRRYQGAELPQSNPDYVAYNVSFKNGETLTGFVRAQDEQSLRLVAADGKETILNRTDVVALSPSATSLMPTGLLDALTKARCGMCYFSTECSTLPSSVRNHIGTQSASSSLAPNHRLSIVLVRQQTRHHGPAQHDYPAWQENWHCAFKPIPECPC